jgi:hypothetical protein
MTKKITQNDVDKLEKELNQKECDLRFNLTMGEMRLIRTALQNLVEFQKKETIEASKKSYMTPERMDEVKTSRGQTILECELLNDKIWYESDLYENCIVKIRDLEWEMK